MILQPGQTILFEGDSLTSRNTPPAHDTWPFLRLMNWHRTYADVMQEWLFCNRPELDLRFRNSAVGGSSAGEILLRFDAVVPHVRPDWIILTSGLNDVVRQVPVEHYAQQLRTYATKTRDTCGGRVFLIGGFLPCPGLPPDNMHHRAKLPDYYAAAKTAIQSQQGIFFDIGQPLLDKAHALHRQHELHTIYSDGGHFNEVGAQIIASLALEALGMVTIAPQ